jgi:flagellar hook-associated protein 3 FlgL
LTTGLATALSNIDNALNNVINVRTSVGSRLKSLDAAQSAGEDRALQYSQTLSRLQDVDYAKAAAELMQQQVGLQAAQQSFVKLAGLSLFNYL